MDRLELATCDRALPPAGTVPDWVHLSPPGRIVGRASRAASTCRWTMNTRNDKPEAKLKGPVPAAGWIKEMRSDETGIWPWSNGPPPRAS